MSDLIHGPLTDFFCLRCACRLGRFPETARGVAACCSTCAQQPPSVHPNWFKPARRLRAGGVAAAGADERRAA